MILRIRAHAKVNLALRVGARRDDGYHPVATILQTVSLADRLYVGRAEPARRVPTRPGGPPALDLSVRGASLPPENTLSRAAELVAGRLWRRGVSTVPALTARLDKRIPIGAGLGGGSSDGAAALVACARLWKPEDGDLEDGRLEDGGLDGGGLDDGGPGAGDLDDGGLEQLARRIGADVPFFLRGGTALGTGRGDDLEAVEPLERSWMVLVAPRLHVSTAEAYAGFDRRRAGEGARGPEPPEPPEYRPRPRECWIENDLEEVVEALFPAVAAARRALQEACPGPVRMTGSGAASFGLFPGRREACRAARRLRAAGWWAEACVTVDREQHRRALAGSGAHGDAARA